MHYIKSTRQHVDTSAVERIGRIIHVGPKWWTSSTSKPV